jgi:hypothetical protein
MLAVTMAAAFALIGGGSYLLSRTTQLTPTTKPSAKLPEPASADAQVLGAATRAPSSSPAPTATSQPNPAATATSPSSQICALTCIPGPAVATPQPSPSFELVVDTASASRSLLSINLPFHVVRHGGLATAIQPLQVSLSLGGSPTSLLRVQATRMTDSDHGVITILNLGLPATTPINGQFTAQSAGLTRSTSFSL